jgi:putative two-component system response regulator
MSLLNTMPLPGRQVGNVLVVDDEPELRSALRRILVTAGHSVLEARSASEALAALSQSRLDVVVLDLGLPDGSGFDVLKAVKASGSATSVLVFTASNASEDMHEALRLGAAGYVRKPADALTVEAQVSMALGRARVASPLAASLEQLPFHLASQLSHAWDLRHIETGAHVRRMAESTRVLARALGKSTEEATLLGQVAMLHDIGKIAIPDAILTKPGKLTDEELVIMKRHAEIGGELLRGFQHPFLDLAATVARSHHERWDGSGYPDAAVGEDCPWAGRLVGIVDVFDALGHTRCYKAAWSRQQLSEFFEAQVGRSFDPEMAEVLLQIMPELDAVKSEYPDPASFDYASGSRLKLAATLDPTKPSLSGPR